MGHQQYNLHSKIALVPPQKLGHTPADPIRPTHGDIAVTNQKYHNNIHGYYLVKNMNSELKKIVVAERDGQWLRVNIVVDSLELDSSLFLDHSFM